MIRILIADDHPIVRHGLAESLVEDDLVVTGEAASGEEVLERTRSEDFDVLILDISMPGMGGLEALKILNIENPDLAILVFSMHSEEQYVTRARALGAAGYITKSTSPRELREAVREVARRGGKFVSSHGSRAMGARHDPA